MVAYFDCWISRAYAQTETSKRRRSWVTASLHAPRARLLPSIEFLTEEEQDAAT
jgi:hypothetical protein